MLSSHITEALSLNDATRSQLLQLWNDEYPAQLFQPDLTALSQYLRSLSQLRHLLLQDTAGHIQGWAWSFNRDGERWFAIIVATAQQGKGMGRMLIDKLKEQEDSLHGWVTDHSRDKKRDGTPYLSPLDFYRKCGFTVLPGQRLETEKMSAVKIRWSKMV